MEYSDLEVYQERLGEIEELLSSLKFEVVVRTERGQKDLEGEG
jgi:diphthamide synthase subunit DPH2